MFLAGLIRRFLHERGLQDVEGFATGSRITGVTFNPKKPAFGPAAADFAGKDFDVTLITSRPLTRSEINKLQALYQSELGHPLGVRNVADRRQLEFIPVYGKLELALKDPGG